jgi:hypothetical protein
VIRSQIPWAASESLDVLPESHDWLRREYRLSPFLLRGHCGSNLRRHFDFEIRPLRARGSCTTGLAIPVVVNTNEPHRPDDDNHRRFGPPRLGLNTFRWTISQAAGLG